jgi:glucose/arabinose dehydrogenase
LLPEAREDWLAVTYAREYADGALISDKTRAADMRDPVLVWLDTQDIRVVRPQEGQRARETRIPVGERVRDVKQGPDGFVYVLTDGERGRVLRLESAA